METCTAVKVTPTAAGDVEVRCAKPADHVTRGDLQHEARLGAFPVRWRSS
ncbi:hypothetical protein [Dactylosporangium fulvum]|uniref:Uncharacterized protein n=1 Tax=Dactylosporangium fulvum TaxID=53359 RepID=A0ABY5VY21_9ACTN|nr:hypothetical protein [Dactylosporangium fulvum]UWP81689.1 hypothetical protein Dfulv_42375 [Dactylosporangium fulvum]